MKFKFGLLLILITLLAPFISKAQVGVGEWRDHLPYRHAISLIEANNKIYCATKSGILIYNKSDNSTEKLSKIQGLSDVDISAIGYSEEWETIIIGYSNGNIDLVVKNQIINVNDIKRKILFNSKTINQIYTAGNLAYLSCGLGIVVFDIKKKEIKDTYQIQKDNNILNINDIIVFGDYIYAATSIGLHKGFIQNNLLDFRNWEQITGLPVANNDIQNIELFDGKIYISSSNVNDSTYFIYYLNDTTWTLFSLSADLPDEPINKLKAVDSRLYICSRQQITIIDNQNNLINKISNTKIPGLAPNDMIMEPDNIIYVADYSLGLLRINTDLTYRTFRPNSPYTNQAWNLEYIHDRLYVTGGGVADNWQHLWRNATIHKFENEKWSTHIYYGIHDLMSLKVDPTDPDRVYTGSFYAGLLEIYGNKLINHYDVNYNTTHPDNQHTLQAIEGYDYIRIAGLAFDRDNNLWMTNWQVPNLLSVKKNDGKWIGIPLGDEAGNLSPYKIINTGNNHKWIILARDGGLLVYDDKGTIDDLDDDEFKKFGIEDANGKIYANQVYSIAEDKEGDIWVGTDQGVYVYYNPENVFKKGGGFYASDILIPRNDSTDLADRLLETETVTCIKVDGANRKWFGTINGGVFLFSEEGTRQILNFNTSNSPILSNHIIDIEINGKTGEVFFATGNGLISYKGTAGEENLQKDLLYVYPNPVRENYTGPITITGLITDSNVKITDISGNLVYEGETTGSQFVWDGNRFDGQRVRTGIYLIFCTNDDGSETRITKLLIVN